MRNNEEIVDILIKVSDEKNISLSELARRVNVAKSAVSRYFNKTREFPLNRAEDFAKALGISTEYLLGFDDDNKNRNVETIAAHIDEDVTDEEMEEIIRYIEYIKNHPKN